MKRFWSKETNNVIKFILNLDARAEIELVSETMKLCF